MLRIGIDVGGTHTDAVLVRGDMVLATTKALTSADVLGGVCEALENVLATPGVEPCDVEAVMLGTTQFTNAVVERRELTEVAAIRIGLPSGQGLAPKCGWPEDIAAALGASDYAVHGGLLYDGQPLAPLDERELTTVVDDLVARRVQAVAITAAFSPMNPAHEIEVGRRVRAALPAAHITLSHRVGGLGLLERENAALLNTSLLPFADRVVGAFTAAVRERGLDCPFFISQNDGTLMDAEFARTKPALTFASGPTNSLRGAARLTGLQDALVVDIGGTTSDIGALRGGFPRQSNMVIEVGGVRTNFRMPDILAVGLGGGSLVSEDGDAVGPRSVGHRLVSDGRVFGGNTLTATDIVVAADRAQVGDASRVADLPAATIERARARMTALLNDHIEQMKPNSEPLPLVLVGGGALLVTQPLGAATEVLRPDNADVANAIGAAIAQIGGEAEEMFANDDVPREQALARVTANATRAAIEAGAAANSIEVADVEATPVSYMARATTRYKVRVVGDIAALAGAAGKKEGSE
ncbi:MAG: hydantoinase/oxoprolinase family protein [Pseudomonadota bacterium]